MTFGIVLGAIALPVLALSALLAEQASCGLCRRYGTDGLARGYVKRRRRLDHVATAIRVLAVTAFAWDMLFLAATFIGHGMEDGLYQAWKVGSVGSGVLLVFSTVVRLDREALSTSS